MERDWILGAHITRSQPTMNNMKQTRYAWQDGDNLFVIRIGKTTNKKIALPQDKIVQTYTFSMEQVRYIAQCDADGIKPSQKTFYSFDASNCMDCPLSGNSGNGKCYTHKYMQFSGFISMLRSIIRQGWESRLDAEMRADICKWTEGNFVRFGTYGEPSLLPIDLVGDMVLGAKSWTGYTHQSRKPWAQPFKAFFMASAHSEKDAISMTGWRSFIAEDDTSTTNAIQCPASKESGFASHCAKCGLCSGITGKGSKNVKISTH